MSLGTRDCYRDSLLALIDAKSKLSLFYLLGEAVGDGLEPPAGALASLLQAARVVPKLIANPNTKAKFINFLFIHSSHKLRQELSA